MLLQIYGPAMRAPAHCLARNVIDVRQVLNHEEFKNFDTVIVVTITFYSSIHSRVVFFSSEKYYRKGS